MTSGQQAALQSDVTGAATQQQQKQREESVGRVRSNNNVRGITRRIAARRRIYRVSAVAFGPPR